MLRTIALLLTTVTGFTGLVYEVTWHKYLAILLGAHSEATAAVLAIFLGGLSLGYLVFGRLSRRLVERAQVRQAAPRILTTYGLLEAVIGLYALAFPVLFGVARNLSLHLPHHYEGIAFVGDVALCALLIGPPTVLMGATIPMLTQALATGLADASRFHALIYGVNTGGAFVGALAGAFVFVPALGLQGTVLCMGAVNVIVGLIFVALDSRVSHQRSRVLDEAGSREPAGIFALTTAALIGGFSAMGLQTIANRFGAFSLGGSEFTFAMIVAVFVVSISLGSLVVAAVPSIRSGYLIASQWLMVAYLVVLYHVAENAGYWAYVTRTRFASEPAAFYPYHLAVLASLFAVLVFPLAMSGAMLPLLFHYLRDRVGDLGHTAGRLYAWNTVGSLLGALLAGYASLFWLDLHLVYRLVVGALALGATILTVKVMPRATVMAGVALVGVVASLALVVPWSQTRLAAGLYQIREAEDLTHAGADRYFERMEDVHAGLRILFYDDDPTTSVAVVETRAGDARTSLSVRVNGKSDGNVPGDNVTMSMLGLLPALVVDHPRRAFVVGYGTGVTVGELAILDGMEEVVVAEISSGVIEAAPFFREYNSAADTLPNVELVRSDAYRAMLRSEGEFDLIVSEPSNPWIAGIEMLLSREFLEAARERLTPRGVYAQWFHIYAMDEATISLVLETYRQAFDRVAVWYAMGTDLLLLGFSDEAEMPDVDALEKRFGAEPVRSRFERIGIETFPELLAHELLPTGVVNAANLGDRVHTLTHPRLSHQAAHANFVGKDAQPPPTFDRDAATVGAKNSLLSRYIARHEGDESRAIRLAVLDETCTYSDELCLTLFAKWYDDEPGSPEFASAMLEIARSHGVPIEPQYLGSLASLFDPAGTSGFPPRFEIANGVRIMFARHYHHAAPFSTRALQIPWERCSTDERCGSQLDEIHRLGIAP